VDKKEKEKLRERILHFNPTNTPNNHRHNKINCKKSAGARTSLCHQPRDNVNDGKIGDLSPFCHHLSNNTKGHIVKKPKIIKSKKYNSNAKL